MKNIIIKKTVKNDCKYFYKLRNNKLIKKFSMNSKNIQFDDHVKWFKSKYLSNYYYTCFFNQKKIGYIRGDKIYDVIYISIVIDKNFRKKNIASKCFNLFEKKIKINSIFISNVLKKNFASKNFFIKNKFSLLKEDRNIHTFFKIHHKN
jgi:hypothetical protein